MIGGLIWDAGSVSSPRTRWTIVKRFNLIIDHFNAFQNGSASWHVKLAQSAAAGCCFWCFWRLSKHWMKLSIGFGWKHKKYTNRYYMIVDVPVKIWTTPSWFSNVATVMATSSTITALCPLNGHLSLWRKNPVLHVTSFRELFHLSLWLGECQSAPIWPAENYTSQQYNWVCPWMTRKWI